MPITQANESKFGLRFNRYPIPDANLAFGYPENCGTKTYRRKELLNVSDPTESLLKPSYFSDCFAEASVKKFQLKH